MCLVVVVEAEELDIVVEFVVAYTAQAEDTADREFAWCVVVGVVLRQDLPSSYLGEGRHWQFVGLCSRKRGILIVDCPVETADLVVEIGCCDKLVQW